MGNNHLTICGRTILEEDLQLIRSLIRQHWAKGRSFISQELCRIWQWRQPNGYLKDTLCRRLLLELERSSLIELPPRICNNINNPKRSIRVKQPKIAISTTPISGKLHELAPFQLQGVTRTPEEPLWNWLIHKYHYQGYRLLVGSKLKYLAYLNDSTQRVPVACLGWGSAVWRLKCRDHFIGWNEAQRRKNLPHLVNNLRFLVLPWVSIKYLASHLLSLNIKRLYADWQRVHGSPIYLLETFVERDRFSGTCYRASNWIYVGQTKGSAKSGTNHYFHGNIKDVYLYPLTSHFRDRLKQP
jgi:hypothetical protein